MSKLGLRAPKSDLMSREHLDAVTASASTLDAAPSVWAASASSAYGTVNLSVSAPAWMDSITGRPTPMPAHDSGGDDLTDASGPGLTARLTQFSSGGHYFFSGNQDIDAVLIGSMWTGATITYSFPTSSSFYGSAATYYDPDFITTFSPFTSAQQTAARYAFSLLGQYTNVTFTEITETASVHANIRLAQNNDDVDNPSAQGNFPGSDKWDGDIWFGQNSQPYYLTPAPGNWGQATVMHEIGHTMGLKHGHQDYTSVDLSSFGYVDGPGPRFGTQAITAAHDGQAWSLMTYRSNPGAPIDFEGDGVNQPQTYMQLDIAALQYMYGADFTTNASNSVYTFSPTTGQMFINGVGQGAPSGNVVLRTIWDGNGVDTYDFSNYSGNQTIDLTPGAFSTFSTAQLANHRAYSGGTAIAPGNIANALLYQGDFRSLIENANGGSGNDSITGNDTSNTLNGNAGNDHILGGSGYDSILGGAGFDTLEGGFDGDTISGGNDDDVIYAMTAAAPDGSGVGDLLNGDAGNDTIRGSGGNDTISGGSGTDSMMGGDGDDTISQNFGGPGEVMDGGNGSDTATWDYSNGSWTFDLAAGTAKLGATTFATLISIENVVGAHGNDTIGGSSVANVLSGNDGDDVINAGGGADTVDGGAGNDRVVNDDAINFDVYDGGAGIDTIDYSANSFALGVVTIDLSASQASVSGGNTETLNNFENVVGSQGGETIIGSSVNNVLDGQAGNDTIDGGSLNDTINGGLGDDLLQGGLDGDIIHGDDGNDRIFAMTQASPTGSGVGDQLFGDAGADTITGAQGGDTIDGGSGADSTMGADGDDTVKDSDGVNFDVHDGGAGIDTIDYSGVTFADGLVTINLATGQAVVSGGNTETISNFENVLGSQGGDIIIGSAGDNVIVGNDGNDNIDGGNGTDNLSGGNGDDILSQNFGGPNETLDGGAGTDTATWAYSSSNWIIDLAAGTAIIGTTTWANLFSIENATGGSGNDTITGSSGVNSLDGGAGDDRLNGNGSYNDTMNGGSGVDTVDYSWIASGFDSANITIDLTAGTYTDTSGSMTLISIENVVGTQSADLIIGDGAVNYLDGQDGNDTIRGGAPYDTLDGGLGTDTYDISDFAVLVATIDLDAGTYVDAGGTETVLNFENVIGTDGAQAIYGTAGNNKLEGAAGNDTLDGRGGTDTLLGGDGDDTLIQNLGGPNEVLDGGNGSDTASWAYSVGDNWVIDLTAGTAKIGTAVFATLTSIENAVGGQANDSIIGTSGANMLDGQGGNDTIRDGAGVDTVLGGDGNDRLYVGDILFNGDSWDGGNGIDTWDASGLTFGSGVVIDLSTSQVKQGASSESLLNIENVVGSQGNEQIIGSTGDNMLDGRNGKDTVQGGDGNDSVYGGSGKDALDGGIGDDLINGGGGKDTATYAAATAGVTVDLSVAGAQNTVGAGSDTLALIEALRGSGFVDHLTGDAGKNRLDGLVGDDVLNGGGSADKIFGGSGNDTIGGGAGRDALNGGLGADTYVFDTFETTSDWIHSLASIDTIDLHLLDANTSTGIDDAFVLVGHFTHVAGQARLNFQAGQNVTLLQLDTDGDGSANMTITIDGNQTAFTHFVL